MGHVLGKSLPFHEGILCREEYLMRFTKVIIINPPNPSGYVAKRDSMGGIEQPYPVRETLFS